MRLDYFLINIWPNKCIDSQDDIYELFPAITPDKGMRAITGTEDSFQTNIMLEYIFRTMINFLIFLSTLVFSVLSYSQPVIDRAQADNQLNGSTLPGTLARSINQKRLFDKSDENGNQFIIARTTRAAQTRTPIHLHEYGGVTCVIEGEMTLYLEKAEPKRAVAGECYDMPAGLMMAGFNSGSTAAVMHDIFTVPRGSDVWWVVEKNAELYQDQFEKHH